MYRLLKWPGRVCLLESSEKQDIKQYISSLPLTDLAYVWVENSVGDVVFQPEERCASSNSNYTTGT
jgi:hypothetical protein